MYKVVFNLLLEVAVYCLAEKTVRTVANKLCE